MSTKPFLTDDYRPTIGERLRSLEAAYDGPIPASLLAKALTPETSLAAKLHNLKLDISYYHAVIARGVAADVAYATPKLAEADRLYREMTRKAVNDACDRAGGYAWPIDRVAAE